jgi:plastocyanin
MARNIILMFAFLFLPALTAWGWYDVVEVKNGGAIEGTIKVVGSIPQDEKVAVTKDKAYCGATLPREKYIIGADGGVKNAVVLIEDIAKGKPIPKESITIDNKKCHYEPHVGVGVMGQNVLIKNDDPMLHNTHLYNGRRSIFNANLSATGMTFNRPIYRTGVVEIECDAHVFMKGYLYIAEHPYIAVTDEKGSFSIGEVPPGTYKLKIWHEGLGEQEKSVVVPSKGTASLFVEYQR